MATTMSTPPSGGHSGGHSGGQTSSGQYGVKKSKHLPILKWLQAIDLAEYVTLFYQYGGVEDILHFNELSLKNLGIKSSAHRAKMASSLIVLREKFHNRWKPPKGLPGSTSPPGSGRSSPALTHTPPSLASHPDYASYAPVQALTNSTTYQVPSASLPSPSLRSLVACSWYHGPAPRAAAAAALKGDGDFLVRDSVSTPGEYVLTARHQGNVMNFKVNKQAIVDPATGTTKAQYQFEEELFDTVPDLVHFYMSSQKPVTRLSGAVLKNPVPRHEDLDYGEVKVNQLNPVYSFQVSQRSQESRSRSNSPAPSVGGVTANVGGRGGRGGSNSPVLNSGGGVGGGVGLSRIGANDREVEDRVDSAGGGGLNVTSPKTLPQSQSQTQHLSQNLSKSSPAHSPISSPYLLRRKLNTPNPPRAGSQPLLDTQGAENNPSGDSHTPGLEKAGSLPSITISPDREIGPDAEDTKNKDKKTQFSQVRCDSEPLLDSTLERQKRRGVVATESGRINTSDGDLTKLPPPKPLRTPSLNIATKPRVQIRNKELYENDDRDYSDYDQVKAWPEALARAEKEKEPEFEQWSILDRDIPPPQDDYDEIDDEDIVDQRKAPEGDYAEISDEDDQPAKNQNLKSTPNSNSKTTPNQNSQFANILRPKNTNTSPSNQSSSLGPSSVQGSAPSPYSDHIYDSPTSSPRPVRRPDSRSDSRAAEPRCDPPRSRRSAPYVPKRVLTMPNLDPDASAFDLDTYQSRILTPDNAILEASALSSIKSLLLAVTPLTLAQHLTRRDLELLKVTGQHDLGLGVQSGLELLLLPQGHTLRRDLIQRCRCVCLFVATTLVTSGQVGERARLLDQWIRTAGELRTATGNLLAFAVIMRALQMKQVQRLSSTWAQLQHAHFPTHQMYEFKLRAEYRTLARGTGGANLGTSVTVPYILPAAELYEDAGYESFWDADAGSTRIESDDDEGSDPGTGTYGGVARIAAHLNVARAVASQYGTFRAAAENNPAHNAVRRENEDLADALRTELHRRLLFGMRVRGEVIPEQYAKFQQVLMAFSMKVEPNVVNDNAGAHRETAL